MSPTKPLSTSADSTLDQLQLFPHKSTLSITSYKHMNVKLPQKIIVAPIVCLDNIGDIMHTH